LCVPVHFLLLPFDCIAGWKTALFALHVPPDVHLLSASATTTRTSVVVVHVHDSTCIRERGHISNTSLLFLEPLPLLVQFQKVFQSHSFLPDHPGLNQSSSAQQSLRDFVYGCTRAVGAW
jgi:hypothetical protein